MTRLARFTVAAAIATASLADPAAAVATFTGLGDLAGGSYSSDAIGASADGGSVVGSSSSTSGTEAFRWTSGGGMVGLGDLPGGTFFSTARGVSGDGSVITGQGRSTLGFETYRWTSGGGMVALGDLPGGVFQSIPFGISDDGSTIVGYSNSSLSTREAFRWTSGGGMVGLGDLSGGIAQSEAYDVSADGSVVVGFGFSAAGAEAFRWTSGGGMVGLGDLTGGAFSSYAHGVTADGAVVVGSSISTSGLEAYRWTSGGGMVGLGDLTGGGFQSIAYDVSANGLVVVGESESAAGTEAFIWDQASGMLSLRDLLVNSYGLDLTDWTLDKAIAISDDGRTIVGTGTHTGFGMEAWIAVLPEVTTAIEWVAIGNPGNAADTPASNCFAASCGSVSYAYQISKYEVSNAQYAEFLNAADASGSNALALYHSSMGSDANNGGISFISGNAAGAKYVVKLGFASKPVTWVSFWDALRFANWLENGKGSGDTETGAYTITSGGILANSITRNIGASIVLASENEWYKAAYYDAGSTSYFDHPAGSNLETVCAAPTATANTANCSSAVGRVSNVGAYTGSTSPYGTHDQGGNVYEWNEQIVSGTGRGFRGGAWGYGAGSTGAAERGPVVDPSLNETAVGGFRVVQLPPDTDDDGIPDETDTDDDGDGLLDTVETDTGTYVSPTNTGSDPLDADSDDDGLLDGAEVVLGTNPNDSDHDDDGDLDGADNCPFIVNANQANGDSLPAGNACQCGDVTNDGIVDASDVTRASQSLVGATLGGTFVLNRCNVVGPSSGPTVCDVGDLVVLERFAQSLPVTVQNACQAYLTP